MTEDIGSKIRAARKKAGLLQKELAEKIGVSESRISQYENGSQRPRVDTIQKIADGLNISPLNLLGPEWFDLQAGPEKIAGLQKEFSEFQAFEQYLISLGYSVSFDGPANTENPDIVLTKGEEKTTFTGDQFKQFEKAICDSVEFQIWQQHNKK